MLVDGRLSPRALIARALLTLCGAVMLFGLALQSIAWSTLDRGGGMYALLALFAVPHAAALLWRLGPRLPAAESLTRVDGLIVLALSYVLWFALVPLWWLSR